MFKVRMPFYEMAGEIGAGSESSEAASVAAEVDTSGDGNAPTPAKEISDNKSFAKRLAEERAKIEAEFAPYREVAEYFRETNGFDDVLTLKERIEMERLQQRADEQGISPELQRRLEYLEQRDKQAAEMEQSRQEEHRVASYWSSINEFVKEKGIEADKLNQFMLENEMHYNPNAPEKSFMLAYKAMRADELEQKLATAEKDGMKKLLQAKGGIPTIPGNKASGQVTASPPKTFAEARQRAMQRMTGEG